MTLHNRLHMLKTGTGIYDGSCRPALAPKVDRDAEPRVRADVARRERETGAPRYWAMIDAAIARARDE